MKNAAELLKEKGATNVIQDPELKENVWIGSTYGFGITFKVSGLEDCLFTVMFDDLFDQCEGFQASGDGFYVDVTTQLKAFTDELLDVCEKDSRKMFQVIAEKRKRKVK